MPVYNSGIYLNTAVDSILNQGLKEIELILVDDGSTDGSSEKCDEYTQKDSRIVVIHQKNGGICNARNAALKIAKGEYIAFSDHDDEYLPGLLENSYNRAKKDNADILKFCKKEFVMINDVIVRTKETKLENKTYNKTEIKENFFKFLNGHVFECVWDGLFKRKLIEENRISFDEYYKAGGEDIDILLRIITKASIFSTMKDTYYLHYIRSGFSTSAKFNMEKLATCDLLGRRITEGIKAIGLSIDEHKVDYILQIMFTSVNAPTNIISNPLCPYTKEKKIDIIRKFKKADFLPSWFCKVSTLTVFKHDKKIALSYFLFKHGMYKSMLLLFKGRQEQLASKVK